MRYRLLLSVVVFVAAASLGWVVLSQPPEGIVRGVCVDAKTGRPVPRCMVWLFRRDHSLDDGDQTEGPPDATGEAGIFTSDDGLDSTQPPAGWQQSTRDDSKIDAAGALPKDRSVLQVRSDASGRFVFAHVVAGRYRLNATSPARTSDDTPIVVEEGKTAQAVVRLSLMAPTLNFQTVVPCWMPGQSPVVGLQGRLDGREAFVEVDRCQIGEALGREPDDLLSLLQNRDDASVQPGLFRQVRRWKVRITRADRDGQFYQRIALGPLPAGLYRVTAWPKDGPKDLSADAPVLVTALAVVRKSVANRILAFVTDAATGHPRPHVRVTLYSSGKSPVPLSETTTSPEGLARVFPLGAPAESRGMVLAQDGDSIAVLPVELNSPGEDSAAAGSDPGDESDSEDFDAPSEGVGGPVRAFIYTDRPVYRPGQTVYLKGIERRFGLRGPSVPVNETVAIDIRDAQQTLVSHQDVMTNDLGSWTASLSLSSEALTGEYEVTAAIKGWRAHGTFAVAAYRKPEYALTVSFDKDRYVRGDTVDIRIKAAYYFGMPVAGAKVQVDVTRSDGSDVPDQSTAHPDDEGAAGEPVLSKLVKLDGSGEARVRIPTHAGKQDPELGGPATPNADADVAADQPGDTVDQVYTVSATVNDNSGRTVQGSGSVVVGQGEFSLNIDAEPDLCRVGVPVKVVVTATKDASAPLGGQQLQLSYGYESWVDGAEVKTPLRSQRITTSASGTSRTSYVPPRDGLLVIRASGDDRRGNHISTEQHIWVSEEGGDFPLQYPDLAIVMDRKSYSTDQTAHLLINTDHPGPSALVTVEGATLYHTWVIPLRRRSTPFDIKVRSAYAPDVTVSVCCFRDRQFFSSSSDLPITERRRALHISVLPDRQRYHPGDFSTIKLKTTDDSGRPVAAELSVAIVDESIYAIRPEPAGTILDTFFPQQSNSVQTANSCERIYMGDVDKGAVDIQIRKDFPDTALWKPVVRTDSGGNATVRLKLPESLTTWRITCVGHTADTAVGKAAAKIIVSKDLLIRLEEPPFLAAGDTTLIVAMVHNDTPSTLHAHVHLEANGLSLDRAAAQEVDVAPGQPARVTWSAAVGSLPDTASPAGSEILPDGSALPEAGSRTLPLQVTVRAGTLSDGVQQPLVIIPHGSRSETWQSGSLLYKVAKHVTVQPNAIPGTSTLYVRLAPSGQSSLMASLGYLANYPYGSTDSTASTLMSDAVVSTAAGSNGTPAINLDAGRRKQINEMTGRALLRLYRFQRDDGGWGWWDAGKDEDLWMTADATWALILAEHAGFGVSDKVLTAALDATARLAQNEREKRPGIEWGTAVPLAALALAEGGRPVSAHKNIRFMMARWEARPASLSCAKLAITTLAANKVGDTVLAAELMGRLWSASQDMGALIAWPGSPHRPQQGAQQDVLDVEATVWALLAAESVDPADPRLERAARWLMASRTGDHWICPGTTAVVALGLSAWMARSQEAQADFTAEVTCNGAAVASIHFDRTSIDRPGVVIPVPGRWLRTGSNDITLLKRGTGRLYYSLEMRQSLRIHPSPPPPSLWREVLAHLFRTRAPALPFTPSGYRIKRVYMRLTSRRGLLWEDSVPARESHFNSGENMVVRLIIDCTRPGSHLIVEEPIPPGCEITETPAEFLNDWDHWWDYTDVRDDRIVFFISDLSRGRSEIDYHLQARIPGSYDVLPTLITGAFDPTLHALGQVDHISIDPGTEPSS